MGVCNFKEKMLTFYKYKNLVGVATKFITLTGETFARETFARETFANFTNFGQIFHIAQSRKLIHHDTKEFREFSSSRKFLSRKFVRLK